MLLVRIELTTSPLPRDGITVKAAQNRQLMWGNGQSVPVAFDGFLVQWHRKLRRHRRVVHSRIVLQSHVLPGAHLDRRSVHLRHPARAGPPK
jgi:hypothetical protein